VFAGKLGEHDWLCEVLEAPRLARALTGDTGLRELLYRRRDRAEAVSRNPVLLGWRKSPVWAAATASPALARALTPGMRRVLVACPPEIEAVHRPLVERRRYHAGI